MTTTTVTNKKDLINSPVILPTGQTTGKLVMSIPFPADYIMILNGTIATIAVDIGEVAEQTPNAQIWTPGNFISLPFSQTTQKITVFWTSSEPITENSIAQFYFSNVTIPLAAANINNIASTAVNIASFEQSLPAGDNNVGKVDVNSLPPLPAGTNDIGKVDVNSLPPLPAGTNTIGKVDIGNPGSVIQGLTTGPISSNQISMSNVAALIVNGVINAKKIKIKNIDTTNSIFIGAIGLTAANGYELFPQNEMDLDIVYGSTINIYGIATAGTPIASVLILN